MKNKIIMSLPDQIFKPERYTYQDYLLWKGDWELVNGYPYAMAPSPIKDHQWFGKTFIRKIENKIEESLIKCNCEAFYELDWIVDEDSVVRPDCVILCNTSILENYIINPPVLIVEISSRSTKLRDRNTKYNLYEMKGVKYYVIADTENKTVEAFELLEDEKYIQKTDTHFQLTPDCSIDFNVYNIWESM